jgi:segregation and condensation protein A
MSQELEQVEGEAPAEPAEPAPEAEVINHLLFHKALIGETQDPARLNAYIEMVKASKEGAHLVMVNPFDRAIAIAFQLVIEKHLDPWKLDLVHFTDMYLERVRKGEEVDLITAGRLIFLAWTVLKLQSDEALVRAEASRNLPPAEPEPVSWDDIPTDAWMTDDGSYAFTTAVLQNRVAPIDEKVRHRGDRKVTLFELVEAFEEARAEAENRMVLDAKRREARQQWAKDSRAGVQGAAHKEDLEAEIQEVWGRITKLNGHPIPLRDLHVRNREDLVKCLVSVLFLAREQRVNIWQENFPYGAIFVQNLNPGQHEPEAKAALELLQEKAQAKLPAKKKRGAATRKAKAKPALDEAPVTARLQVGAAVAQALARILPPEVRGHG